MVRLCALALVLMTADGACAQSWPSRPIRAIVPYTAGGAIDIVSRTVAQQLSLQLGHPIVIESRPGAGGVIGTAAVAKADPDGHTILLTASSHTISPWAYSNLPYDTVGDLAGITERLAKCGHVHREDAFLHGDIGPDQIEQLALGHQRTGTADERHEHIVRLRRERYGVSGFQQPALTDIERVGTEFVHFAGASHDLAKS